MSIDHYVPLFSAMISFFGLLLVFWQLRQNAKQRESESMVNLYDINRQLITLGFSHPVLFDILADKEGVDPIITQRYLQLWLNQLSLSHTYLQRFVSQSELKESVERNLADFMTAKNMQQHWRKFGSFYPASFQKCVNEILKKVEPPTAAHVKSGR